MRRRWGRDPVSVAGHRCCCLQLRQLGRKGAARVPLRRLEVCWSDRLAWPPFRVRRVRRPAVAESNHPHPRARLTVNLCGLRVLGLAEAAESSTDAPPSVRIRRNARAGLQQARRCGPGSYADRVSRFLPSTSKIDGQQPMLAGADKARATVLVGGALSGALASGDMSVSADMLAACSSAWTVLVPRPGSTRTRKDEPPDASTDVAAARAASVRRR